MSIHALSRSDRRDHDTVTVPPIIHHPHQVVNLASQHGRRQPLRVIRS